MVLACNIGSSCPPHALRLSSACDAFFGGRRASLRAKHSIGVTPDPAWQQVRPDTAGAPTSRHSPSLLKVRRNRPRRHLLQGKRGSIQVTKRPLSRTDGRMSVKTRSQTVLETERAFSTANSKLWRLVCIYETTIPRCSLSMA